MYSLYDKLIRKRTLAVRFSGVRFIENPVAKKLVSVWTHGTAMCPSSMVLILRERERERELIVEVV